MPDKTNQPCLAAVLPPQTILQSKARFMLLLWHCTNIHTRILSSNLVKNQILLLCLSGSSVSFRQIVCPLYITQTFHTSLYVQRWQKGRNLVSESGCVINNHVYHVCFVFELPINYNGRENRGIFSDCFQTIWPTARLCLLENEYIPANTSHWKRSIKLWEMTHTSLIF